MKAMSLRRSILTLIFAIAVIGLGLSYWHTRGLLVSIIDKREAEKAGVIGKTVESFVEEYSAGAQLAARVLSTSDRLARSLGDPGSAESLEAFASILIPLLSDNSLDVLEIADGLGIVCYSTNEGARIGRRSEVWGVEEALQGQSGMVAHKTQNGTAVLAIEPIYHGNRVVGAVIAGRRLNEKFIKELSGKVNAGLALMSSTRVLASSGETASSTIDRAAVEDAFHQKIPVYRKSPDKRATVIYIPMIIVDEGFVMMVMVDSGNAFHALRESFVTEILWTIAFLLISVVVASFLLKVVLRPLRNLRSRAERTAVAATGEAIKTPDSDEIGSVVHVLDTLTERLLAQNRDLSRSRADAQAANEAKSRFLAGMSHEIRTPLNGVLGMAELLRETPLTPDQSRYCQAISASGRTLYGLLSDILDLSKIEAGKIKVEAVDFDLERLLSDITSAFTELAAARSDRLSVEIDIPAPGCFRGDPTRLRQVLSNLLGNAVKFTYGGDIALGVSALEPREGDPRTWLRFSVRDSGIGIEPGKINAVFGRFTQADDSTTRRYGGTGLGLVISKHLVELMGGSVEVESAPGAGSRFWFDLPFDAAEDVPAARAVDVSAAQRIAARVLLVEDNQVNQEVLCAMLNLAGADVLPVDNGELAVLTLRREEFDIVLMDCQMPVMDGYEATRRIRREEAPGRHVPIIALTANAFSEDRERCLAAGMDDYITKPVSMKLLARTVGRWTGHARGAMHSSSSVDGTLTRGLTG